MGVCSGVAVGGRRNGRRVALSGALAAMVTVLFFAPAPTLARLVVEDPFAPIMCATEQDCVAVGGTSCSSVTSGPIESGEFCPDICACDDISDFPQDAVFQDALVIPLDAHQLGVDPQVTELTVTRSGIAFSFQSASGGPLFVNCTPTYCPLVSLSQPVIVTVNPPVDALGVVGGGRAECGFIVTIVGDAGFESYATGFDNDPVFVGADGIGAIGSASLDDTCHALAEWTALGFVPAGPAGPAEADASLAKTAPESAGADAAVTYRLGAGNAGPDSAGNVTLADFLPDEVTVDAVSTGGSHDAAHGIVTWPLPDVAAGTVPDPQIGPSVAVTTAPFIAGSCLAPAGSEGRGCTVNADCDGGPGEGDGRCFLDDEVFTCEDTLTNVAVLTSTTADPALLNNFTFTTTVFDKLTRAGRPENCATHVDDNCDGLTNCDDPACGCGVFASEISDGPDDGASGDNGGGGGQCTNVHGESFQSCCCDGPPCNFGGENGSACNALDPNFLESDPPTNAFGFGNSEAGQIITYTIHYENIGGVDAPNVLIVNPLEADLDDSTLAVNDGGAYDSDKRLLSWRDPLLPPATPRMVSYSIAVRADAPPNTRVRNRATIVFPTALEPRTDTNFLEHVVVDPTLARDADLAVIDCAVAASGADQWRVMLQNAGLGFAYDVTAAIVDPPPPVQVVEPEALFAHPADPDPTSLSSVMPRTRPTSVDTVTFTTETPVSPCDALVWRICHRPSYDDAAAFVCEEVQYRPDQDHDAVADAVDSCPGVFNPTQAPGEVPGDLDGDCDADGEDRLILWGALRQCEGSAGYIELADYDGDSCVTFGDYRIWYGFYAAQR